jgi:FMN phosphatase YigB (HAD superfamily)
MSGPMAPVFLLDVDNTLIDNDRVVEDLMSYLDTNFGRERRDTYKTLFEELRDEVGYADYLGALQRYRMLDIDDPHMLEISTFLIDYPFHTRLFPGALDVIRMLSTIGTPVVLSDGDVVFQPRKIKKSGIWDAVGGRVLIYIHKEHKLASMKERFPSAHYVMIDDKVRILHAMKSALGGGLTTIFPRQGHYAKDPKELAKYPSPDISIDSIGDLLTAPAQAELRAALAYHAAKEST